MASRRSIRLRAIASAVCVSFFASCATQPRLASTPEEIAAAKTLAAARAGNKSTEERAALYLQAADSVTSTLGTGTALNASRETYNEAAGELTVLLRSAENGRLWNHSLTLTTGSETYHLRLQSANSVTWAPDYFTSFTLSDTMKVKRVRTPNRVPGVGGKLVGVRNVAPRAHFAPVVGITAPVTATLDFHGKDATLALRRPEQRSTEKIEGKVRPLAADYSAPLLYYKPVNETIVGLMGALNVSHYSSSTGLYFLQPYDPKRIPLIFVHGLISTPQMWLNVINKIEADPILRDRYQYWVFGYPTGNPIAYSALRFREELAKVDQVYPDHRPYVFISHSLGGLLSQMQTTTVTRADWDEALGPPAQKFFAGLAPNDLIYRALVFHANPKVKRVVFICTPHLGSDMAIGPIGRLGMALIRLPFSLVGTLTTALTPSFAKEVGIPDRPNVVSGLSPKSPTLKVMAKEPVQTTYHSIIGNRGRPGPLAESSDGVVPYWSSHIAGAQSELIVPGPHSSCELPQTIAELKRILLLHLQTAGN